MEGSKISGSDLFPFLSGKPGPGITANIPFTEAVNGSININWGDPSGSVMKYLGIS